MMDATCSLSEVAVLGTFERGNLCELLRVLIEFHWPERFVSQHLQHVGNVSKVRAS
jgi:hypothetical protein